MTTDLLENSLQRLKLKYRLDKAKRLSQLQQLPLIQYHTAQETIASDPHRFKVVCCGRKFGKTRFTGRELIERMMRGQRVASLAPVYEDTRVIWDDLVSTLPPELIKHQDASRLKLTLVTEGSYQAWSMDAGAVNKVRPHSYDFIAIDEAAFVPNLLDAWHAVLRPTLARYQGEALFLSTPNGFGDFHTLSQKGIDPTESEWAYFHYPTSSNPHIPALEIEAARRELPERIFRQEYLAEFIADGSGVFRGVSKISTSPMHQGPLPGFKYVLACDWGRMNDFTVIIAFCVETMQMVAIDRFNRIDWFFQRERLKTMIDRWHPVMVLAEENSIGDTQISELQREGLNITGFQTTGISKPPLIEQLALAIEQERITIQPDPVLLNELNAYTMKRSATGRWQYEAPSGGHDDTVIALALAYDAVLRNQASGSLEWLSDW
jgi:hypothetical protein